MRASLRRSSCFGVLGVVLSAGCAGTALVAEPLARREPLSTKQAIQPLGQLGSAPRRLAIHERWLFLATTGGELEAVSSDDGTVERVALGERVVDVHRTSDDHVWALTVAEASGDVRVWERERDAWVPVFEMMGTDEPIALGELAGHPLIVTSSALFWTERDRVESLRLDDALEARGAARVSVATVGRDVYVGVDRGALGGALAHVDLVKGSSELVARTDGLEGCSGTFDPSCDSVAGLEMHPMRPGCALVGIRRNELPASGRLLRVCATQVERERGLFDDAPQDAVSTPAPAVPADGGFEPPLDLPQVGAPTRPGDLCEIDPEPCATFLAGTLDPAPDPEILALASDARGVWISSPHALVRWSRGGQVERRTPELTDLGHERVMARPDVVGLALDRWQASAPQALVLLATPAFATSIGVGDDVGIVRPGAAP